MAEFKINNTANGRHYNSLFIDKNSILHTQSGNDDCKYTGLIKQN